MLVSEIRKKNVITNLFAALVHLCLIIIEADVIIFPRENIRREQANINEPSHAIQLHYGKVLNNQILCFN